MLSTNRSFQIQNSICSMLLQTILLYETCIVMSWKSLSDVRTRKWRRLTATTLTAIGKFRFHIYIPFFIRWWSSFVKSNAYENTFRKWNTFQCVVPYTRVWYQISRGSMLYQLTMILQDTITTKLRNRLKPSILLPFEKKIISVNYLKILIDIISKALVIFIWYWTWKTIWILNLLIKYHKNVWNYYLITSLLLRVLCYI